MSGQLSARSSFTGTFAIHVALKSTLKSKRYEKNTAVRKAAEELCRELESEQSIYGRQLKMIALMERGATLGEIGRKLRCSRRTVFRYLNHLEDAGISITLHKNKYRVDRSMADMRRV